MTVVGRVESLWRYPVKSVRGEEITQSYLGFSGVYGDRLYAFHDIRGYELSLKGPETSRRKDGIWPGSKSIGRHCAIARMPRRAIFCAA
jgi:hypothetical protein